MSKPYKKGLFLFRRDVRLEDNLGLLETLASSELVIPAFIFDPRQVSRKDNPYFSEPAFSFLLTSLHELNEALQKRGSRLNVFYGDPAEVVETLITKDHIDAVYMNKDYTPFARKRDGTIETVCKKIGIAFFRVADYTLSPIEDVRTGEGKIYTIFTPFMKRAMGAKVASPRKNNFHNYFSAALTTPTVPLTHFSANLTHLKPILSGGRSEALTILKNPHYLAGYKDRRNLPADTTGTSHLSAHHKFGTISIRESYQVAREQAGAHSHFIAELYWRDFYYYIAYHFPPVFGASFLPWAKHLPWINDRDQFAAWCAGQTGVPIVDAGMRELNTTGFMHNRTRMIVASYLTKNLLVDWQWGERYFATKLIDYDPAQNNGGWQWSASTGADPKPIRIFNPYTQATKYDPEAIYIKTWVPELAAVPTALLTDSKTQDFSSLAPGYPAPLVDQKMSFHRATEAFRLAKATYKNQSNTPSQTPE
jgi:deoxyribodipyrimidine photo-lyase